VITDAKISTNITRPSPPLHALSASTRNSTSVSEGTLARIARSPAIATMTAASEARLYVSHACAPSCPCAAPRVVLPRARV
jgi:hypothetical protein